MQATKYTPCMSVFNLQSGYHQKRMEILPALLHLSEILGNMCQSAQNTKENGCADFDFGYILVHEHVRFQLNRGGEYNIINLVVYYFNSRRGMS